QRSWHSVPQIFIFRRKPVWHDYFCHSALAALFVRLALSRYDLAPDSAHRDRYRATNSSLLWSWLPAVWLPLLARFPAFYLVRGVSQLPRAAWRVIPHLENRDPGLGDLGFQFVRRPLSLAPHLISSA